MLDCNGTHDDINQGDDKIHPGHGALGEHVRLQAGDSRAVSLYKGEEQVTEHVDGLNCVDNSLDNSSNFTPALWSSQDGGSQDIDLS